MKRLGLLAALACLGLTTIGCATWPPSFPIASEPAAAEPSAAPPSPIDAARSAVDEGRIDEGIALYREIAADPAVSHEVHAESLYVAELLELTSAKRPDLGGALSRLRQLRDSYPTYQTREVQALIRLSADLLDTRADLQRQREALENVTKTVIGN